MFEVSQITELKNYSVLFLPVACIKSKHPRHTHDTRRKPTIKAGRRGGTFPLKRSAHSGFRVQEPFVITRSLVTMAAEWTFQFSPSS